MNPVERGLHKLPRTGQSSSQLHKSGGGLVDRFDRPPRAEFAVGDPNDDDDERVSDRTELVRSLGSKLAAAIEMEWREREEGGARDWPPPPQFPRVGFEVHADDCTRGIRREISHKFNEERN